MAGLGNGGGGSGAVRAARAFVEIGVRGANTVFATLDKIRAKMQAAGAMFAKVGTVTAAAGALSLRPVITTFADFDDAIRAAGARATATAVQLDSMRQRALELGRTTSFTATEVAALMGELGTAGFKPDEINVMTAAVLDLARATGTDATRSAEVLGATMNAFQMKAEEATRVADAMSKAANVSAVNLHDLGESFKFAGPIAADFGVSLEDTLAIVGGLGNMGIRGEMAGTMVRRLGQLIAKEEPKLNKFGVTGRTLAGDFRPMVDVLEDLRVALSGMGKADQAVALEDVFGIMGVTGASAIGKSAASIREMADEIKNSGGEARRVAQDMDAGLGGSLRRLRGAAEGAVLMLGDVLAPVILTLASVVQLAAGSLRNLVSENREVAQAVLGTVVGVTVAGGALALLGITVTAVAGGLGVIASALGAVLGVVGALLSPTALLTAGLVALGVQYLRSSDNAKAAFDFMKAGFTELNDTFQKAWGGIVASVQKGDLEGAFKIAGAGLRVEWQKVVLFWTEQWVKFKNGFLKDLHELALRIEGTFVWKTGKATGNLLATTYGKINNQLVGWFRNAYIATGIIKPGGGGGPGAPAPGAGAPAAMIDPLVAAANAKVAAAQAELDALVAAANQPLPDGIDPEQKKRLEEHNPGGGPPARPVLDVAAVKGGFSSLNARQMFGISDTWQKKQQDALDAIKNGKGELPLKIGMAVAKAFVLK